MDRALYEQHAALEGEHWWFVGRRAVVREVLRRHLPATRGNRILDVGCGTGGMLPLLAELGTVSGIEGDELAVDHARAAFSEFEVRCGQIPDDVPTSGDLDLVTAFDVIEHLDDDGEALIALRGAVRPGGSVMVTVPALPWLWSDHDRVNGHRRRYTRAATLLAALCRADLPVVHLSYFNTVLLPLVAASRLADRVRPGSPEPDSDFTMPSPPVNRILTRTLSAERRVVAQRGLPVGVSLIAVARRAD